MVKKIEPEQLVNLTPHEITIVDKFGIVWLRIPPSGQLAHLKRAFQKTTMTLEVNCIKIPVSRVLYGEVDGLPDEDFHHLYVVSRIIKSGCPDRDDVLVPGEMIRDQYGRIIGCLGLDV